MSHGASSAQTTVDAATLTLRQTIVAIFVAYAGLTLVSSTLALATGGTTDTHVHLLLRFGMTTIGVGAFYAHGLVRRRRAATSPVVMGLATYALALAAAMAFVWLYGLVEPLHPDAYRDVFLNFTAVGAVLTALISMAAWWRRRRGDAATAARGA